MIILKNSTTHESTAQFKHEWLHTVPISSSDLKVRTTGL